jgi:hypothetical protein
VFGTVDLHQLSKTLAPASWLMRRGKSVAAVDPQTIRHHPLAQRLNPDSETVTFGQLFRRECRTEVDVVLPGTYILCQAGSEHQCSTPDGCIFLEIVPGRQPS